MSALVVALYDSHAAAEQVRTQLVSEGFPTDRVELTSQREPGQAAVASPSDDLSQALEDYFTRLFDREEESEHVRTFVDGVQEGRAALTVHPRGDVETDRALQIIRHSRPLHVRDHDLHDQAMEQAASRQEETVIGKVLPNARDKRKQH